MKPRGISVTASERLWQQFRPSRSSTQFDCDSCRYQFSVMSGTMFHDTHLALTKWFFATYLICESKKGMSANQLKRMLRVSYETAWYLCHRIRAAMAAVPPVPKLDAIRLRFMPLSVLRYVGHYVP